MTLVYWMEGLFPFKGDTSVRQFDFKCLLITILVNTWSKFFMDCV